jgi:glycosyltransferase involved in cell wall biosynthesis
MSHATEPAAIRHLGICCVIDDPHRGPSTPDPKSQFGRWISSILGELRRTDPSWRFVLWTTKAGRTTFETAFGGTDVALWPPPPPPPRPPVWAALLLRDAFGGERVGRAPDVWFAPAGRVVAALKALGRASQRALGAGPLRFVKSLSLPILGLVLWLLYGTTMLAYALSATVCLPYRGVCRRLTTFARRRMSARPEIYPPPEPELSDPPSQGVVSLWIAPSALCHLPTSFPFVLLMDETPIYAAADRLEPSFVVSMNANLRAKAPHALLIVSPHRSVLDHVAHRQLGLPPQKLRRCPASRQSGKFRDESRRNGSRQTSAAAPWTGLRYLICPSGADPEKNLETLLLAFALVRQAPGYRDLHLVLAGVSGPLDRHPSLLATVLAHGLDPFVHLVGSDEPQRDVGRVEDPSESSGDRLCARLDGSETRPTVQTPDAFCNAAGAVFPSLYESSADAVLRALEMRCPVACATIFAFEDINHHFGDACVSFEPRDPRALAEALLRLLGNRARFAARQCERFSSFVQDPTPPIAWRDLLDEADAIGRHGPECLYAVDADEPYRLALVLQQPIPGGTWESAREIVEGLAALNRRRRQFDLQFIHHPDQPNLDKLRTAGDVACVPRVLASLGTEELQRLCSGDNGANAFFCELDREALLDRDALFFLTFSFPARLAPVRPYGVLVLDMVLFQLADRFPESVRAQCRDAIGPTFQNAELLITTSDATRTLVREYCDVDERRLVVAPLGCETYRRLVEHPPAVVDGLERPFLLNITNYSPHKGARTVVEAYIDLRRRLGEDCPMLVFAGCLTETFLPSQAPAPSEYVAGIRRLIAEAGLIAGRDIVCLGMISDEQAAWLYGNCAVVLNAALADNGTYCLIEGRYFGRPIVTSDYPAVRWLCERFRLPAHYFPVGDPAALADRIVAALDDPALTGDDLIRERKRLEADEFSRARFVERLYDHLLQLAETGRQRRLATLKLSSVQQRSLRRMATAVDVAT